MTSTHASMYSPQMRAEFQKIANAATSEERLYHELCEVCVRIGGFRMAWFGLVEHDEHHSVRPVAHAGHDDGYLEKVPFRWDASVWGLGPTGHAIRNATPSINWDWTRAKEVKLNPWREEALKRGFASSMALPLIVDGKVIGALTLYSSERAQVGDGEVLASLMNELAKAVKTFRSASSQQFEP